MLYQILDEEGFDPIGQALTLKEAKAFIKENPLCTYREANPNFIQS